MIGWCTLGISGALFHGVAIVAAMCSHQSGSGERLFHYLGYCLMCLVILVPYIRDHYEFVLCYTYGVLPDIPLVYGGVYDIYIKCVKGDNGNALTLF